jgi:histone H3/H4
VRPATIRSGNVPKIARHPGGARVREEAEEALCKLREEATWSTWMEEGGSDGAL